MTCYWIAREQEHLLDKIAVHKKCEQKNGSAWVLASLRRFSVRICFAVVPVLPPPPCYYATTAYPYFAPPEICEPLSVAGLCMALCMGCVFAAGSERLSPHLPFFVPRTLPRKKARTFSQSRFVLPRILPVTHFSSSGSKIYLLSGSL